MENKFLFVYISILFSFIESVDPLVRLIVMILGCIVSIVIIIRTIVGFKQDRQRAKREVAQAERDRAEHELRLRLLRKQLGEDEDENLKT